MYRTAIRTIIGLFVLTLFSLPAPAQTNQPPEVELLSPNDEDTRFYITQQNAWYQGIQITYRGSDTDGSIDQFGYAVDNDSYQWTSDTIATIPPSGFGSAGQHTIRLTAEDNDGTRTASPDSVQITLVSPTFDKEVLIVDGTREQKFGGSADSLDDHMVDSLYSAWVNPVPHEQWDTNDKGLPPRDVLGQYETVFWHYDHHIRQKDSIHAVGAYHHTLSGYMETGGNLILSGWRPLLSFYPDASFKSEHVIGEGEFLRRYYNISTVKESDHAAPGDMVGALGVSNFPDSLNIPDYPDLEVSKAEIYGYPVNNPDYEPSNYTNMVDVTMFMETTKTDSAGGTVPLYTFQCKANCTDAELRGQIIGVHQMNHTFESSLIGFPLLFMKDRQVNQAVDSLLGSMNHDVQTGISSTELPDKLQLDQNYPNPFNPTTRISYKLPVSSHVELSVYNTLGQRVARLVDHHQNAGSHSVTFNASHLPSGIYIYQIETGGISQSRKMLLVK